MGILSIIGDTKAKFRKLQTASTEKKAELLAELRKERIRAEGQAKIDRLYNQEKARLKNARRAGMKARTARFRNFASNLQKTLDKNKPKATKSPDFARTVDLDAAQNQKIKEIWGMGTKKTTPKKRGKEIVIKL